MRRVARGKEAIGGVLVLGQCVSLVQELPHSTSHRFRRIVDAHVGPQDALDAIAQERVVRAAQPYNIRVAFDAGREVALQ